MTAGLVAPDRPLRLVTVTHFFPAHGGGLEGVAGKLVREFARQGAQVQWFSSDTDPAPEDQGTKVTHIAVPTWNLIERLTQLPYPLWSPLALPQLWRAIGRADVVHIHEHLYASSIVALLLSRMRGKPVIVTQHMGALGLSNRTLTALYESGAKLLGKLLFPLASRSVFISANVQRFFQRNDNPRSGLIYNGIDNDAFTSVPQDHLSLRRSLGIPDHRQAVLFVGRLVRKKGLHIVRELAQRSPEVFWMIVGSGPENPAAWNLPNVRVYGRVEHDRLPDYYRAADLLILPSSGEGFPLVVQESLCCGTAVLSTDEVADACPPAAPMIRTCPTPRTGFNIETWNHALAQALADVAYMSARDNRSEAARALWSWQGCAQSYLGLFSEASE